MESRPPSLAPRGAQVKAPGWAFVTGSVTSLWLLVSRAWQLMGFEPFVQTLRLQSPSKLC